MDRLTPEERERRRAKMNYTEKTIDEFLTCDASTSCKDRAYLKFMMWQLTRGYPRTDPAERAIPLKVAPSEVHHGINLFLPADSEASLNEVRKVLSGGKKVIVGSVRMGYGHHRIAYSALTWALELGAEPYLMDILAPDCVESAIVRDMDKWYSKMSRLASNAGGCIDNMWGSLMLKGDINALRLTIMLAERIRPILAGLPTDVPIITSYPMVGNMAVACGFKTVINLIFDNHPQYFVLVPGALNLVQSPSYFDKLLDMGCPAASLRFAGHWVSSDLCKHVAEDCTARINRCGKHLPRRFLVSVGGAGAQLLFLQQFLVGLKPFLRAGRMRMYINCGDHAHMASGLVAKLRELEIEFAEITDNEQVEELCRKEPLSRVDEPMGTRPVTVFRFVSHFVAFRCTDLLCRVADILVTKPSELAFFPVPKLHIRRVGAHEAFSADRASEIGDGTVECRTVQHAVKKSAMLMEDDSPLFLQMNRSIMRAAQVKTYEGSRIACECALGLKISEP